MKKKKNDGRIDRTNFFVCDFVGNLAYRDTLGTRYFSVEWFYGEMGLMVDMRSADYIVVVVEFL